MAISPITSALDIYLNSPAIIKSGEEFVVTISADTEDIYDIKIFVHKDTKEFSQIYDNGWKSTRNFINEAYPSKKEFKLKPFYSGETQICLRFRKPGATSYEEEVCSSITVDDSSSASQDNQNNNQQSNNNENDENDNNENSNNNNNDKENEDAENKENSIDKTSQSASSTSLIQQSNSSIFQSQFQDNEPIILSSSEKQLQPEPKTFVSKQAKVRNYSLLVFTIFLVIIIILLALRKL